MKNFIYFIILFLINYSYAYFSLGNSTCYCDLSLSDCNSAILDSACEYIHLNQSGITSNNLLLVSNIENKTFSCDGNNVFLNNGGNHIISISNSKNITIRNCNLEGGNIGISFTSSSKTKIENVKINNTGGDGILLLSDNSKIRNYRNFGSYSGVNLGGNNITIENTSIENYSAYGILSFTTNNNISLYNLNISTNGTIVKYAIYVDQINGGYIKDTYLNPKGTGGIWSSNLLSNMSIENVTIEEYLGSNLVTNGINLQRGYNITFNKLNMKKNYLTNIFISIGDSIYLENSTFDMKESSMAFQTINVSNITIKNLYALANYTNTTPVVNLFYLGVANTTRGRVVLDNITGKNIYSGINIRCLKGMGSLAISNFIFYIQKNIYSIGIYIENCDDGEIKNGKIINPNYTGIEFNKVNNLSVKNISISYYTITDTNIPKGFSIIYSSNITIKDSKIINNSFGINLNEHEGVILNNVSIKNERISSNDFNYCIKVQGNNTIIENSSLYGCIKGLYLIQGNRLKVKNITINESLYGVYSQIISPVNNNIFKDNLSYIKESRIENSKNFDVYISYSTPTLGCDINFNNTTVTGGKEIIIANSNLSNLEGGELIVCNDRIKLKNISISSLSSIKNNGILLYIFNESDIEIEGLSLENTNGLYIGGIARTNITLKIANSSFYSNEFDISLNNATYLTSSDDIGDRNIMLYNTTHNNTYISIINHLSNSLTNLSLKINGSTFFNVTIPITYQKYIYFPNKAIMNITFDKVNMYYNDTSKYVKTSFSAFSEIIGITPLSVQILNISVDKIPSGLVGNIYSDVGLKFKRTTYAFSPTSILSANTTIYNLRFYYSPLPLMDENSITINRYDLNNSYWEEINSSINNIMRYVESRNLVLSPSSPPISLPLSNEETWFALTYNLSNVSVDGGGNEKRDMNYSFAYVCLNESAKASVFVFDRDSLNPIFGVDMRLTSTYNGRYYTTTTDANGIAIIDDIELSNYTLRLRDGDYHSLIGFEEVHCIPINQSLVEENETKNTTGKNDKKEEIKNNYIRNYKYCSIEIISTEYYSGNFVKVEVDVRYVNGSKYMGNFIVYKDEKLKFNGKLNGTLVLYSNDGKSFEYSAPDCKVKVKRIIRYIREEETPQETGFISEKGEGLNREFEIVMLPLWILLIILIALILWLKDKYLVIFEGEVKEKIEAKARVLRLITLRPLKEGEILVKHNGEEYGKYKTNEKGEFKINIKESGEYVFYLVKRKRGKEVYIGIKKIMV